MISSIGTKKTLTPIEIKMTIQKEFSSADYIILRNIISQLADYGLRAGGKAACPKCGSTDGTFIAMLNDKFFRPTLGDLREWKNSKRSGGGKDIPSDKKADV